MARSWDATRPTLAERARADLGTTVRDAESDRPRPAGTRHCWVTGLPDAPGRHAGLLVEWRRDVPPGDWLARVVYAVDEAGSPVLVEAWLSARHLTPAPAG